MKSNYRKIGDFIQLVDERNKDLKVTKLLGLSISKQFIPSVANIFGTNMANYKIIRKNQFACSTMQVRRDKKMPMALLKDFEEAIISQAYPVFEVVDETILNPEYLMMWFTRSEFDRHACFLAVGGVRGSLEWEDFLEMPIPVPSIEKQLEIVKEYNIIVDRVKLNETLNQKLEDTAQALYKHWFLDFEFPNADGRPYKSSGGKMVFNEELDLEIPDGWELTNTDKSSEILFGYSFDSKLFSVNELEKPLIRIRDIISNKAETFTSEKVDEKYIVKPKDLLIGMDGKFHCRIWLGNESYLNQRVVRLRENSNISIYKIFFSIQEELLKLQDSIFGTTVSHLSNGNVRNLKIIKSPLDKKYQFISNSIIQRQNIFFSENLILQELKDLLLSKMSKVETKTVLV
ncbi:restriction endonuclease subunit S [uncultured Polaribacter sp.]|uniref:restriction endonuclease subunit S n=1 Tax=uncultured Polaribacter sp. TaxID=174711 RepID=UPI002615AE38|nr:restriction endonuclease subunit S [uncultured Polaribacter sp.]